MPQLCFPTGLCPMKAIVLCYEDADFREPPVGESHVSSE